MPVKDTTAMIAAMTPVLTPDIWVYCSEANADTASALSGSAFALVQEDEGATLILPFDTAQKAGYDVSVPMSRITLNVYSDLEGVGLTAAVARALTDEGISCNVVAAYHHDHVFVPIHDAARALEALEAAQSAAAHFV
ncbi:MAG: ACT domain-containing protein [Pseudomonadota bacterium]